MLKCSFQKNGFQKNGKTAGQGSGGLVAAHISVMDEVVAPELPQPSANLIDLLMAVMDAESMVAPAQKTYVDSGTSHHYFS
jgi:hypothetical protein